MQTCKYDAQLCFAWWGHAMTVLCLIVMYVQDKTTPMKLVNVSYGPIAISTGKTMLHSNEQSSLRFACGESLIMVNYPAKWRIKEFHFMR
eukprot:4573596-Amphidinium_carterae.1